MATIQKFEDLEVWKLSKELCEQIYKLKQNSALKNDFALWNQMNRSSGSIMDNIAEGFERNGNKEFRQFLSIAKGSAGEVKSQLYRLRNRDYCSVEEFEQLKLNTQKIINKIGGLIFYLNNSNTKVSKFKTTNNQP